MFALFWLVYALFWLVVVWTLLFIVLGEFGGWLFCFALCVNLLFDLAALIVVVDFLFKLYVLLLLDV